MQFERLTTAQALVKWLTAQHIAPRLTLVHIAAHRTLGRVLPAGGCILPHTSHAAAISAYKHDGTCRYRPKRGSMCV